jgi:hypothetical protein
LLAALLGGCMLTPAQRREDNLVRDARQYNDDLRWQRYEALTEFLTLEEAAFFKGRVNDIGEDLVMADSEVLSITFGNPSDKATCLVKVAWYTRADPVVRSTTLEQRWELQSNRWVLTKQRRTRGDRFPLVTEPAPLPTAEGAGAP